MINPEGFRKLVERHRLIGEYISAGKEIPHELSRNFLSFPLLDDPYEAMDLRDAIGSILKREANKI